MGLVENNVGFFFHSLQTTIHCSVSQSRDLYFTTLFSSLNGWPCLLLKNKNKNRKYPGLNSPTSRTNCAPNPGTLHISWTITSLCRKEGNSTLEFLINPLPSASPTQLLFIFFTGVSLCPDGLHHNLVIQLHPVPPGPCLQWLPPFLS